MVLKNYGSSVLTVQSRLGAILRTIISVATLPELSPTAIHESALTCPPLEIRISREEGRLLERFTKRIEGSHGTLQ